MAANIIVLKGVERCPHCAVANPLIVQYWAGMTSNAIGHQECWALFACTRCGSGIAARGPHPTHLENGWAEDTYPTAPKAHSDIPDIARTFLQQAMDTLHAPDAAAVMAGSAVDAMLKELGYSNGSVYNRIDEALKENKLTQGMADWAHEVRLGSNRPRHADVNRPHVTVDEAKQSVEFAEALANFLFVLTARIQRGIQAAAAVQP